MSEVPFRCSSTLLVLPTNIRLGWRGWPGKYLRALINYGRKKLYEHCAQVAYYSKKLNYGRKMFYNTGPTKNSEEISLNVYTSTLSFKKWALLTGATTSAQMTLLQRV
jgi:hypothetical protein